MSRILCITIFALFLISCTNTQQAPTQNTFYAFRITPPTLLEFSPDLSTVAREIPVTFPPDCGLFDIFPSPRGTFLAVELSCSFGQTVLFLDPETGSITPAYPEADSHFLAWTAKGAAAFIKINSAGTPQIVRTYPASTTPSAPLSADFIPITELTYDIAPKPDSFDFTFTLSRGLGFGSELWLAKQDGRVVQQLYADQSNYIAFARWSPDGNQIAFIKIPDSQVPFTIGELWLMDADGSNARKLADADAGHGYAANWSPEGRRIAFVVRENAEDSNADESSEALISNIYIFDLATNEIAQVTEFSEGRAETPQWSPDGNMLFFLRVVNGRMELETADLLTGEVKALLTEPACCPSWMRK
jgi:hypothetical protein